MRKPETWSGDSERGQASEEVTGIQCIRAAVREVEARQPHSQTWVRRGFQSDRDAENHRKRGIQSGKEKAKAAGLCSGNSSTDREGRRSFVL